MSRTQTTKSQFKYLIHSRLKFFFLTICSTHILYVEYSYNILLLIFKVDMAERKNEQIFLLGDRGWTFKNIPVEFSSRFIPDRTPDDFLGFACSARDWFKPSTPAGRALVFTDFRDHVQQMHGPKGLGAVTEVVHLEHVYRDISRGSSGR